MGAHVPLHISTASKLFCSAVIVTYNSMCQHTHIIFVIRIRANVSTLHYRNQTPITCKFDDGEDDFIADIQTCFRLNVVYKTGSGRHTISPNDIVQSQVQWNYECC